MLPGAMQVSGPTGPRRAAPRATRSARPPTMGHHRVVTRRAELSSLASSLDELTRRVTALAEDARETKQEELAGELFGVERALHGALRRLGRLADGRA